MIIQCDKCSTKFRLEDSKVSTSAVKVRCTKCQNVFVVQPPQLIEAAEIEDISGREEARPPAPPINEDGLKAEPPATKRTDKPRDEKHSLKFDFARPDENMMKQGREETAPLPEKAVPPFEKGGLGGIEDEGASIAPDLSFGDIDLNFVDPQKTVAGRKAEEDIRNPALPQARSGQDPFDFDFSIEGQKKEEAASAPFEKTAGAGNGALLASQAKAAKAFNDAPSGRPSADEQSSEAQDTGSFTDALDEAISKESAEERPVAHGHEATRPASRRSMAAWIPAVIAAGVVILAGLAVFYISGGAGRFAAREKAAMSKPIDIEAINGYMAENKNIGRIFVIEALIRNITDSAQGIKEVRGVIYDSSGTRIIDRIVSPGRVVSAEELKNLPKEGLIKALSDTSGSLIPPKATVPVMVLFTEIPEQMAEYGLDVIL
ncbi:MAG: DUF3426 domain-containing protein [Deltaproteobacteria bacterium]